MKKLQNYEKSFCFAFVAEMPKKNPEIFRGKYIHPTHIIQVDIRKAQSHGKKDLIAAIAGLFPVRKHPQVICSQCHLQFLQRNG